MSALTDRIAREHWIVLDPAFYTDTGRWEVKCRCGARVPDGHFNAHIAAVTEAALREQVAQDIEAEHTDASSWVAERHLAAWQAALAAAAKIARGGAA